MVDFHLSFHLIAKSKKVKYTNTETNTQKEKAWFPKIIVSICKIVAKNYDLIMVKN